eukprot:jgi/Antlo1/453/1783
MSRSLLCVLPGLSEKVACSKRCIRPRLSTAALDCAVSRRLAEVRLHEACTREEAAEWCSMLCYDSAGASLQLPPRETQDFGEVLWFNEPLLFLEFGRCYLTI